MSITIGDRDTLNTMKWLPTSLDIFTCDITTSVNRHLRFLNLPRELRDEIYSYCVEGEQENIREWVGHHRNADRSDFCTPLHNIRPPSLIRVCKQTREEYLPIYFHQTCFRVCVPIDRPWLGLHNPRPQEKLFDQTAEAWVRSMQPAPLVRNIQFRFTHLERKEQVGASLNITFSAKDRKYRGNFICNGGWDDIIERVGWVTRCNLSTLPLLAWELIALLSIVYDRECMDLDRIEDRFCDIAGCDIYGGVDYSHLPILENWSEESFEIGLRW